MGKDTPAESTLYNADCLEGMKELPDSSIDLLCTDPPYYCGATSNGIKASFGDFQMLKPFWRECFTQWQRVLKEGAHLYINTDWRTYPFLYPLLLEYFQLKNLIVWDYEWIKAGAWYRPRHEFIIFCTNGKSSRQVPRTEPDVWRLKTPCEVTPQNRVHKSQKPVELCKRMILNSSSEGDVVLDSFCGSGSTGVACVNTNRNFIGFELDEGFYKIAEKRISEALAKKTQELF